MPVLNRPSASSCHKVQTLTIFKKPLTPWNPLIRKVIVFKYMPRCFWKVLTGRFLCTCRRRVMKTSSVNYITSQLMRFWTRSSREGRADRHDQAWPSEAVWIYVVSHASSLQSFTYLSELIVVWHPLILFLREARESDRNVPFSDFGRWEICWAGTLIWTCGHKFAFTHSLSLSPSSPAHPRPVACPHFPSFGSSE